MVYIKSIGENRVQLGGGVATQEMIDDGWFEYDGPIPEGTDFKLVNGVLQSYVPEISPLTQIKIYKDYLSDTDFKMLPSYIPKEGEDLEAIKTKRNQAREYIRETESLLRQPPNVT
jgi:hypothetical protein